MVTHYSDGRVETTDRSQADCFHYAHLATAEYRAKFGFLDYAVGDVAATAAGGSARTGIGLNAFISKRAQNFPFMSDLVACQWRFADWDLDACSAGVRPGWEKIMRLNLTSAQSADDWARLASELREGYLDLVIAQMKSCWHDAEET